jgi:hypothetical protein
MFPAGDADNAFPVKINLECPIRDNAVPEIGRNGANGGPADMTKDTRRPAVRGPDRSQ